MKTTLVSLALFSTAIFLFGCDQETIVSPDVTPAALHAEYSVAVHAGTSSQEPFTHRAPLDPYRLHELPDFMIHSKVRTDIVMQRLVFTTGAGPWHTHPGPSFVFVEEGQIKLNRYNDKDGCTETEVFGPGQAYFEVADEVHRAVVLSTEGAVLHVTRFNIPVGGAITIPAADPGC